MLAKKVFLLYNEAKRFLLINAVNIDLEEIKR
jgi:hypothetical protein